MGPGKDTHGTPVPKQWGGRGWPDQQDRSVSSGSSTQMQKLCLSKTINLILAIFLSLISSMPSVCIVFFFRFLCQCLSPDSFQRHVVRCPILCLSPCPLVALSLCPLLTLSSCACVHGVFLGVVCVSIVILPSDHMSSNDWR